MKFNPDGSIEMSVEEYRELNGESPVLPALKLPEVSESAPKENNATQTKKKGRGRPPSEEKPENEVYILLKKSAALYPDGWKTQTIADTIGKSLSGTKVYLSRLESKGLVYRVGPARWAIVPE